MWRGTVVSDDALVTCIQELRKALGDDSRQPVYIETRHRHGYRFVALVSGYARKFSVIPLMINIGSGLGLLSVATVLIDILVYRFFSS